MPIGHTRTGADVCQFKRFSEIIFLAGHLAGRDDYLAKLMLEDALEELERLLGDDAQPIARLAGERR